MLISQETVSEIEKEIAALSENCKKILLLRIEGFSYREIAEKLVITEGTVKTQISRARKKIQKILEK